MPTKQQLLLVLLFYIHVGDCQIMNLKNAEKADVSPLLTFAAGVIDDNYALKHFIDPVVVNKTVSTTFVTIQDIEVFGLSNIRPSTEIMIDFDGRNVMVNGIFSVQFLQFAFNYKLAVPFAKMSRMSGHVDEVSVALEIILPVDGVNSATLPLFRIVYVGGYRITNAGDAAVKMLANSNGVYDMVVKTANTKGKEILEEFLLNVKFPPPKKVTTHTK